MIYADTQFRSWVFGIKSSVNFEPPLGTRYLWQWFRELDRSRPSTGFGFSPISYSEIDCWRRLLQLDVKAWEVEVIKELDFMLRMIYLEKKEADDESKKIVREGKRNIEDLPSALPPLPVEEQPKMAEGLKSLLRGWSQKGGNK